MADEHTNAVNIGFLRRDVDRIDRTVKQLCDPVPCARQTTSVSIVREFRETKEVLGKIAAGQERQTEVLIQLVAKLDL